MNLEQLQRFIDGNPGAYIWFIVRDHVEASRVIGALAVLLQQARQLRANGRESLRFENGTQIRAATPWFLNRQMAGIRAHLVLIVDDAAPFAEVGRVSWPSRVTTGGHVAFFASSELSTPAIARESHKSGVADV